MAVLDDELMNDARLDAEIIAFVHNNLSQEIKEKYDEELLYYFHDVIEEYLANSNVLDEEPDEDGFVNIDVEEMAKHLQQQAKKDGIGVFPLEDLLLLVEAELSFGDDFED